MTEELKKKKKGVRLTSRDLQIILWINSHRAVTGEQVSKKFGMSLLAAKKRLYELKGFDYLVYEKIFHDKPGIYRVGLKGIAVTNDKLQAVKLRLGSYEHDLQLVDLAIMLEQKTGGNWQTDRQIRHEKGLTGVGVKGHSADGIIELTDGRKTAVELELTAKATKRLENIIKDYAKQSEYLGVWYFVNSQALGTRILKAAGNSRFIRVFLYPEMTEIKSTIANAPLETPEQPAVKPTPSAKISTPEKPEIPKPQKPSEEQKKISNFFRRGR